MLGGDPASCYAALEALLFLPHHLFRNRIISGAFFREQLRCSLSASDSQASEDDHGAEEDEDPSSIPTTTYRTRSLLPS